MAAVAASLSRPTSLETSATSPSSLCLTPLWHLPDFCPISFSASVSNGSFLLFTRPDTRRVRYINRHVWWTLNLPVDPNSLNASFCENDGRQYAQAASGVGRFSKTGKYEEGRVSSRSSGKHKYEQTFPNSKGVAVLDDVLSHKFVSADDSSQYADKADIRSTLHTKSNHMIEHAQRSHQDYPQSQSEPIQNDGKAPVFTSKLEEILSKFKRKPGFHKGRSIEKETRHDYIASQNEFDGRYGGFDQVQEKNVPVNSRQTAMKNTNFSPYFQKNGQQNVQRHHKKGRSNKNNLMDMFGDVAPSKQDLEDGFMNNSYLNIPSNHHTAWEAEIPYSSIKDSHVQTGKSSTLSQTRMSRSIGSRSSPSRSSDSGSAESNVRFNRNYNGAYGRKEKRRDNRDRHYMIFDLGKTSTTADRSESDILDENFLTSESSDGSDADDDNGGSQFIDLEFEYDDDSGRTPLSASQQTHPPTLPISHNESSEQSSYISSVDNNVLSSNQKNGWIPNVASWHKHSIPGLPFDFQYSYSENPKAPVVRYREVPFSPFGPTTMSRPWTGRAPLKPSKKKLPEFDSFKPPPRGKKGIKFVQDPGPYPEGEGPKLSKTREEILGEPLTKEEIVELVEKSHKERRQLNLGRDGLTHNMLDLIHCHWKRRRVCRIKCIGVPTVDMENVCFHIEDKTGGKVIYRTGGILYLFRGRNYNYKDRPKIPIMLWKPVTPVYPKLIQEAPEGLTIEEAKRLRQIGEKVEPMCKLAKNGVYLTLVEDVRAAFRIDELVRIDCQGLNPSDYKKIGAKLKELVPCVLLSFDNEHILMWKGKANDSTPTNESLTENAEHESSKVSVSCDIVKESFMHEQEENVADDSSRVVRHPLILETIPVSSMDAERDLDSKQEKSADGNGRSKNKIAYFEDLWDGAIASGMALELCGENLDCDLIVKKVAELAASAPVGPTYTERLISKLKIKMDQERKTDNDLRIHFGKPRKNLKKRNHIANRSSKELSVDVPESGGLPVNELASLLAPR